MKKNLLSGFLLMAAVSVVAQTIDNAFFDKVNYRGAFGTTNWAANWTNFNPKTTDYPTTETTLSGDYSADKTLGSPLYGVSSFTDAAISNSFFTKVDYIGAFGKTN